MFKWIWSEKGYYFAEHNPSIRADRNMNVYGGGEPEPVVADPPAEPSASVTGDDVDGITGEPVQVDSVPVDGEPPKADDTPPAEPQYVLEVEGKKYTQDDLAEVFEAHANQTKWKSELSEKGEQLNILQKALEMQRQTAQNGGTATTQPQVQQQTTPALTGEQFTEMFTERPQEAMLYVNNLIEQSVNQAVGDFGSKQELKNTFMSEYPDYMKTVNSSEFQNFMSAKPYFNEVNGYLAYQLGLKGKEVEQAGKEGFNKGEKKTIQNLKTKGAIKVLTGGGASVPQAQVDLKKMPTADFLNAATAALIKGREQGG